MARNSMADMVMEASDIEGAAGGIGRVARGSVKVASGIGGVVGTSDAAGAGGTDSIGCSSCCGCSACGGTRSAGLGGAATGVE